ncbi:MAG: LLM class flavin-dependent oxidoreductase, partial [Bacteroidota bacterium]
SFASATVNGVDPNKHTPADAIQQLIDRIEAADKAGLDVFGIGEHHRKEFLDSAPVVLLAAAASRTKRIKLTSAVTVLSAADPVRVFQQYATLDLVSNGRAEMVVGRGSFIDAYPLFGLNLQDYDELFIEKLELLLKIRHEETINWAGRFRPALNQQSIYPRPLQQRMPIWLGVGGTPESFVRAGSLGLPLMVAIIGGETHRFRPLVDLYRQAGKQAGHPEEQLTVGLHSFGYVAETTQQAKDEFFPGYFQMMTRLGRERGWSPPTRQQFEAQCGPTGAYIIGGPDEVAEKIHRHSKALGGISRLTFQMDTGELPHAKLLSAIELLGRKVKPLLRTS